MNPSPFRLDGKTILITGASSGIGRASAIECSRMGATLLLTGRNHSRLQQTANLCDGKGHKIISGDLTMKEGMEEILKKTPPLDGVVLNAGINKMQLLTFYNEKDIEHIFSVNCFAPILLIKNLIKKKKLNRGCSIVFMASISGYSNIAPANGVYGASKGALSAFMKYAALELASKGIRCNAIHPGRVETPLIHQVTDEETIKADLKKYPLGRYADPQEIAYASIFLLSDAAKWITGSDLVIDGGRSLL